MTSSLTVIIPVRNTQGYLTECLDSVLTQQRATAGIELVAVDDASSDHSGELIDERAATDPRVVPVHLAEPGDARNLGLDRATGDYVWFVDGDHRIVPDALAVVVARLVAEKPDVLVVGVAKEAWNRKVTRWTAPVEVRTGASAPAAPPVPLGGLVIRREFLAEKAIRFRPGPLAEIAFGYDVLSATDNVATIEAACYVHRVPRQPGRSAANRAAVSQYEHVLSLAPPSRATVERVGGELLDIMASRVPKSARRAMLGEITALLGRHGVSARRLLAARRAERLTGRLRGLAGKVRGTLRRSLLRAYYRWQLRLPMDESLAVYAAYWYRGYACNPAAIYETAKELAPGVKGVWVSKGAVPPGVPAVKPGTRAYFRALARAKYLINNATFPAYVVKRPGAVHVQTHHGTPLKTMGLDQPRFPASLGKFNAERMLRNIAKWDFSVTANRHTTLLWDRQFPIRGETLETGYPRNDVLARATPEDTAAARAELGIAPGERVVLYAPTHREWHPVFTPVLDVDALAEALGPNTRVLLRGHYFYDSLGFPPQHPRVIDVSRHPSVEQLMIASDAMITDFSSVMFDYAVLDRPLVIFAPDWDVYKAVRGVTFELPVEHPGTFVRTFDDLVGAFRSGQVDSAEAAAFRARFRERFCSLEDGHAAERVVRRVFLGERLV
jgi:CDP-glycerol glycerophosphotransferase